VPRVKAKNIKPNCLNVDKATIFFASVSKRAASLATINVNIPNILHILTFIEELSPNRIINQTPAVTRVDLCTKDLTGVGAAIAAGSHLMNGHWALLVKVRLMRRILNVILLVILILICEDLSHKQNIIMSIASPNRFVSKVNSPPLALIQFW